MKALIAMSGGVDSSVSAYLTKKLGYECIGATMKLVSDYIDTSQKQNSCCSLDDVEDARSVSIKLGIPYYVFNYTDDFDKKVIKKFILAYQQGFTPNPCIDCNRYMKFDKLYNKAKQLNCDKIVTGHYARILQSENGRWILKKAKDNTKDQSYVLYSLTQDQLAHTLLPVGDFDKTEIRDIAEKNGFINASKHDSQDICFVTDGKYYDFIEKYENKKYENGNFVDLNGKILGEHKGIIRYTVGQRKGLGISFDVPHYVVSKDINTNTVVLGTQEDLYCKSLVANDFNWLSIEKPIKEIHVMAKTRYNQKETSATAKVNEDNTVTVTFDTMQKAVALGQAVVLYQDDMVLGGGTIIDKSK